MEDVLPDQIDAKGGTMSSTNETKISIEGENLNLELTPGSEEEWKRTIQHIELVAQSVGVRLSDPDSTQATEDIKEVVDSLESEIDELQASLEAEVDNSVSEEELESKLSTLENRLDESQSEEIDVNDKLAAMWDMLDDLEDKVDVVYNDFAQRLEQQPADKVSEQTDNAKETDNEEETVDESESKIEAENRRSLEEVRDMDVSERNDLVFEIIKRHQPVHGLSELGEHVYGQQVEPGSKEYGELGNRVSDIQDRIEKEPDGTSSVYYVNGDRPNQVEGTQRLDDIDQSDTNGMRLVCAECRSEEGVFSGLEDARNHRRKKNHDSWIVAAIPNDDWANDKTIENIVDRRAA